MNTFDVDENMRQHIVRLLGGGLNLPRKVFVGGGLYGDTSVATKLLV